MPRAGEPFSVGKVRVHQRGKWWHASYTLHGNRHRKALKVTNKEHAEARAQAIYDLIREGNYTALTELEKNRHVTFAQFLAKFRQDYHNWDENTWRGASGLLSKLVTEFGEVPLSAITTHQLEGYLARRVDQGLKTSTRNRYVSTLRTIFRKAKEWDYVTRDPAQPLKTKKAQQTPIKALTREELEKLLKALPDEPRQVAILAAFTGMRKSELQALRWGDVDLTERTLTIVKSKNKKIRTLYMTDRVYDVLMRIKSGSLPHPQLKILHHADIKRSLHTAGMQVGIGHVHMHMLRHTFATLMRDEGVPLDRIMEALGHSSMDMVLRYAKARPQQLKEAFAALDG